MSTIKLKELLDEFEEWVVKGRAEKIPYQEWRRLKQHAEDQVRVERDGWGKLGIFSETCWKSIISCPCDDGSLGTYLSYIHVHQLYDNAAYDLWQGYNRTAWQDIPKAVINESQDVAKVVINEKGLHIDGKNINNIIDETANLSINRKENNNMNLFKGFDFGSCENDNVKVSIYGIAVKNATGTWVSYDPNSGNIIDVDILNFDAKYLYKMPVAIKDVSESDVIIHNRKPMFVSKVEGSKILAIDPAAGEEKVVILTRNMFGFDFVIKVVNLFGNLSATANADSPFGNILPLMLLADEDKSDNMLPLMFAMNGGKFDMSNPMMLYFLMKDNKSKDILPFMFFANGQGIAFGKTEADAKVAVNGN